jgi:hypothetical protein
MLKGIILCVMLTGCATTSTISVEDVKNIDCALVFASMVLSSRDMTQQQIDEAMPEYCHD